MKKSSHQARNRQRLANFVFSALSILLLASYQNVVTAQEIKQSIPFETNKEKISRATLEITNSCSEPHRFRVTSDIEDPRFKQQTDAILIGATSTEKIEVLFDAKGSKSNFKAIVECLDCKKEEGCSQVRDKFHMEITAVEPPPLKRGEVPAVSTRFSSGLFAKGANDVGIIPQSWAGCPVGSDHIYISMDDEDNHPSKPNTSSVQGWTGDISRYSTGTTFGFCRVDGNQFGSHPGKDYAVLQLATSCPAQSVTIFRTFDNEHNPPNNNWSSGEIEPNKSQKKVTGLSFCFFPAGLSPSMNSFPNFHVPYGVFAAPSPIWFSTGTVHTDDEDVDNKDNTTAPSASLANRFAQIIYGTESGTPLLGRNTDLLVAKVEATCTNPCPYIGSYDTANCWVGQPPTGTTAAKIKFAGLGIFFWTPDNGNCPIWYDGAGCSARTFPPQTKPFIWSNMWYVEPICRP